MVFRKVGKELKGEKPSDCEQGAELVEFIGFIPWILIVGLIVWQFMVFGHAMLTTGDAARQGARAAAAYSGAGGAVTQAVGGRYDYQMSGGHCGAPGEPVVVTVRIRLPIIDIPFVPIPDIWTTSTAIARCEPIHSG